MVNEPLRQGYRPSAIGFRLSSMTVIVGQIADSRQPTADSQ
jgi:hypothetical protein